MNKQNKFCILGEWAALKSLADNEEDKELAEAVLDLFKIAEGLSMLLAKQDAELKKLREMAPVLSKEVSGD